LLSDVGTGATEPTRGCAKFSAKGTRQRGFRAITNQHRDLADAGSPRPKRVRGKIESPGGRVPSEAAALALLDEHKISQAAVVGNSVGGWVAATFAGSCPGRVSKLILIDVAGFKAMFEGPPPVNFDPGSPAEMQKLIDITINSSVARTPGIADKAYRAYVSTGERGIAAVWAKSVFVSPRLEEVLPKISAPTLVLWGADDKLFPSVLAGVIAGQIRGGDGANGLFSRRLYRNHGR
jgi:pimeloyl-ACP methyl ester carboxylesterase